MSDDETANARQMREAYERQKARAAELEAQNAAQAAELAELAEMRAEVVFVRAGVNTTRPTGRAFFNHYDGELTVEAVRQGYAEHLMDARQAAEDFASRLVTAPEGAGGS